jgi:spermidine/putrescine transport system substrate-binding protein
MSTFSPKFRTNRRNLLKGGIGAVGVTFLPRFALAEEEKKLNFYNWDTYTGETTLADFNAASGIEVKMDLFADNAELFAKLKAGNPGYDLIVPTNNWAQRMMKANMLVPLDHAKIPNFANYDPHFQDAEFDPGRKFTMAYMWGTTGIGYRKSKVDPAPDSWKFLLDDDRFAGRISLLSSGEQVLGAALKYLGYSYNSTNVTELTKAKELLIAHKKNVKQFGADNGQDLLATKEVDLCLEYNGDIVQVMKDDDDLNYIIPKEGSNLWQDTLAIPVGAPHPENAHAFINFMLDGTNGKNIATTIQYATPNKASRDLMEGAYKENPAIFPPDDVIAKCEPGLYLGEEAERVRDEIFTAIKAA